MSATTVSVTAGMTDGEQQELAKILEGRAFEAGQTLFAEGAEGRGILWVTRGRVQVTKRDVQGAEQTLAVLEAPVVLGEVEIVTGAKATASVVAETDGDLLQLSQERFEQLVSEGGPLACKLVRNLAAAMAQKLSNTNELYADVLTWNDLGGVGL